MPMCLHSEQGRLDHRVDLRAGSRPLVSSHEVGGWKPARRRGESSHAVYGQSRSPTIAKSASTAQKAARARMAEAAKAAERAKIEAQRAPSMNSARFNAS